MATHSSFLAWRIPWTEEPVRLQTMGSQRVRQDWATEHTRVHAHTSLSWKEGDWKHTGNTRQRGKVSRKASPGGASSLGFKKGGWWMLCVWKLLSHAWLFATPWNSPGQNTGVGSLSLLQRTFSTQESTWGLLHCRWILYQLSHKGNPRILE